MNNRTNATGITLPNLLTIVFIVLKLCGAIKWSWWWVLAPTWIPLCLAVLCVVLAFIIAGVKDE